MPGIESTFPVSPLPNRIQLRSNLLPDGAQGWPMANDLTFPNIIDAMSEAIPDAGEQTAVSLIVGNGFLNSVLAHTKADECISVDISPLAHHATRESLDTLRQSSHGAYLPTLTNPNRPLSRKLIEARVRHAILNWDTDTRHPYEIWQNAEQERLGDRHFLANAQQYQAAQEAAQRTPVSTAEIDLFDVEQVAQLAGILAASNCCITFANFTNVHEWTKRVGILPEQYCQSIGQLPFHDNAMIVYSVDTLDYRTSPGKRWPTATWVPGLDAYRAKVAA